MHGELTFGLAPPVFQECLAPHGKILTAQLEAYGPCADPLVLTDYADILWADHHRNWYPNLIAPSGELLLTLTQPSLFHHWMVGHGFEDLMPAMARNQWPRILKEDRLQCGGWGVFVAHDAGEYFRIQGDLLKRYVPWIEQEAIVWPVEYGAHHLVIHGEIRYSLILRIRLPDPLHIKRGVMDGEVVPMAFPELAEVYHALNYTGFACVNFKKLPGQTVKIFEINPRMGGSLILAPALLAGAIEAARKIF